MKITIKSKAESTVQRNLRVPVSLNKQMNDTSALADQLGADYHATLIAAITQFDSEFRARLLEMKSNGERATTSGITAGSASLPGPVEQPSPPSTNGDPISAGQSAASSSLNLTSPDPALTHNNGVQKERP
ncbi:MAG TPA: hypothetical protein VMD75_17415 [Candidatus Binataceae bacterium]|nr:hypothetical protein [Candidatus Binataceae bacterium]